MKSPAVEIVVRSADRPASEKMSSPSMTVATAFSSRPPSLGLDHPLLLSGGERDALARLALDLGFAAQPEFRRLVEAAIEQASDRRSLGLTLRPMLLAGPAGVGRVHLVRRLAQICRMPHVAIDLSEPSVAASFARPGGGVDVAMPAPPVLAMAASGCANPFVSLLNLHSLDRGVQDAVATMIDPATAHRWVDVAARATIDMRRVSWFVHIHADEPVPRAVDGLLEHVQLKWPVGHELRLHQLEVLAEAAADLGLDKLDPGQISAALNWMNNDGRMMTTAHFYATARRSLER